MLYYKIFKTGYGQLLRRRGSQGRTRGGEETRRRCSDRDVLEQCSKGSHDRKRRRSLCETISGHLCSFSIQGMFGR
eukprot:755432-Hanusia_phi.AAC.4